MLVHPAHTRGSRFAHLEHVRHHDALASNAFRVALRGRCPRRALYSAAFLETEGVHRQHGVVARQFARPCRQHGRHSVIHAVQIAGDVVERMRRLQPQHIARIPTQQLAPPRLCAFIVIGECRRDRSKVQSFALVGGQLGGTRQHRTCQPDVLRIATGKKQVRLKHMRHHKARRLPKRRRKLCVGPASPALEGGERAFVGFQRRRGGAGNAVPACVDAAHSATRGCGAVAGATFRFMRTCRTSLSSVR
jgi:hypothetical protein